MCLDKLDVMQLAIYNPIEAIQSYIMVPGMRLRLCLRLEYSSPVRITALQVGPATKCLQGGQFLSKVPAS